MQNAENIAIRALGFLSKDEKSFQRFLDLTGISIDELRVAAASAGFLTGVLDHIMQDESLLLVFSQNEGIEPQLVSNAHSFLTQKNSETTEYTY